MSMDNMRFRQIHMDFHTSPLIPDVGADFDPDEFANVLSAAYVDSVTIFAKCHHGYSYYPTKVGVVHPSLPDGRDLLGETIEALHRRGIRCPVYIAVVWDEYAAGAHGDWLQIKTDGQIVGRAPMGKYGWRFLCMNTPYLDYVEAQAKEIAENYPIDGLFYDIVMQHPEGCCCNFCMATMARLGLRPDVRKDRLQHNKMVEMEAVRRLEAVVHSRCPNASVFFNSRMRLDARPGYSLRSEADYYTHFEIESLPSGVWGYLHFPMYARHLAPMGKDILGMNGRFHTSWGDFGGLRNRAALEYEVFRMLSLGAHCSIGDQLHPRGQLDRATYELIGEVYGSVAAKEEWCRNAELTADIGVLVNSRTEGGHPDEHKGIESDEGATQILTELHQQFHVLDFEADFSPYRVIIAPDGVLFDGDLAAKVGRYVDDGGSLLLTGESGLTDDSSVGDDLVPVNSENTTSQFALSNIPAVYWGPSDFDNDYMKVSPILAETGLATDYSYVLYGRGQRITAAEGAQVLATLVHPYFNRTWKTYCSHRQTPPDPSTDRGEPLAVRSGRVIYIANPLFKAYRKYGYRAYKQLIAGCLNLLLPQPLLISNLPSTAEATLLQQEGRQVVHILHYTPQRRAEVDIVEDVIPLYEVELSVRTPGQVIRSADRPGDAEYRAIDAHGDQPGPQCVYLVPSRKKLPFVWDPPYVRFTVPKVKGHQMAAVQW